MSKALIEDALRRIGEGEDEAMDLAGTALLCAAHEDSRVDLDKCNRHLEEIEVEMKRTSSGTAMAIAYQTQLTRQRISREPRRIRPRLPSVNATTTTAAISAPGAKKLFHGMAPQVSA